MKVPGGLYFHIQKDFHTEDTFMPYQRVLAYKLFTQLFIYSLTSGGLFKIHISISPLDRIKHQA